MGTERTRGLRCFNDSRELRSADGRHHSGGAHRAWPNPDLEDCRAGSNKIANRARGHDVASNNRHAEVKTSDDLDRLDHALLVPVCGVNDEDIGPGLDDRAGFASDIAVDPDGGADCEAALRIHRRCVQRRAQRATTAHRANNTTVANDRCEVEFSLDHEVEGRPR